jgi:photosystem II stability/assembly factor-like uncharacterized protein
MVLVSDDGGRSFAAHLGVTASASSVVAIERERLLVVGSRGLALQPINELTGGEPGSSEGRGVR